MLRILALLLAALAAAITPPAMARQAAPVVILVSLDGFRADYLDRGVTPNLAALAARGVSAAMRPSFPSKTFPNHWAIVTGKVPDHNGIVANRMEDPARPGEVFTMASDDPFWWNEAAPVWVDAEKAGIRTATMFWPGSNVAWGGTRGTGEHAAIAGGTRPRDWQQFNGAVTPEQRVNAVLDWLRRPATIRPRFVTLYFDTVDTAGHTFGPDDPRTTAALAEADGAVGALVKGLRDLRQPADLVIVADHGMAGVSSERTIALDRIADPALYRIVESGPYASLVPTPGSEAALDARLLAPHPHMQCWRRQDIPARLRYGPNPRIPPRLCLAEIGWQIVPTPPTEPSSGGAHGYDNAAPEMAALFIASGPRIARGGRLPSFDNVAVAALLRDLLGLPPAPDSDGDDTPFRKVLRR
ncbi:ectonucleotide pyrophosphatase/phosphodiesterase [Novosphingobium album (ex Liu et al. 2023)]|uniref:Ectonucleotide pyrophosphatase/phosphodiesterase n=1 Tax=Novosphingobium album (ex Liu et al. 2023) TaxID=3031130 RepID=A0ABT5WTX9_9SPHN|nr:ectonucleotide pyrophosphatase/phosphodiesterase [Novosphingobium album (ex Liu et al. 2023)]MDE8653338.1 ectonucleotide pyrophosphatase/phosphodiesterase [Novosphingobium album (ex Liu et al. 2023)]